MRIVNSIEHLPRSTPNDGNPPSRNPFAVETFARMFDERYAEEERDVKPPAIPEAGPFRASMSTMRCDRELWYALTDTPRSEDPTVADRWTWFLGQIVHEHIQPVVERMFPAGSEVEIDLREIDIPGSAHADLVAEVDGHSTLVEITTVNGFKFKRMACRFNGVPEGPAYGKVIQALLAAKAAGVERVVVMVISLEKLSPSMARQYSDSEAGRFLAEWHYTVTEMEPQIEAEARRIRQIVKLADLGVKPERELHDPEYPTGAIVTDPTAKPHAAWQVINEDGNVVDTGTYWGCNYCPWQTHCKGDD